MTDDELPEVAMPMTADEELDFMEQGLRAIKDSPRLAELIAATTLTVIDANRLIRSERLLRS